MSEKKFTLNIGCHRGTITNRDATSETFDTYDAAYKAYQDYSASYRRFGYVVWFADIVSPEGEKTHLESNPYYS